MRKLVVEHNVVTIDGKQLPSKILDGSLWGDSFDDLCDGRGVTYEREEGFNSEADKQVTYNQTFLVTDLTDEELLRIFI